MIVSLLQFTLIITLLWSFMFIKEIQDANVSDKQKILAYITLISHDFIVFSLFVIVIFLLVQSIIYKKFYYKDLLITNAVFLIIFISFTYYRMCVLTILYNYLLDKDKCSHYHSFYDYLAMRPIKRQTHKHISKYNPNARCSRNFGSWLEGTRLISFLILLLNIIYIFM
jgi:hypothetical protein